MSKDIFFEKGVGAYHKGDKHFETIKAIHGMDKSIEGLKVIYDFITLGEEAALIERFSDIKYEVTPKRGGRSSIKRYGSSKPYHNFMAGDAVPDYFVTLVKKIISAGLLTEIPDHVTVNVYDKGDYIAPHIDSPQSGPVVTVLSLAGNCDFVLEKDGEKLLIPMPPRTLLQLSGEMRYDWKHSILPVKELRYSIVFRNSKQSQ